MPKKYCPTCGSTNVERMPKPLWDGAWYCKECETIMSSPFTRKQYKRLRKIIEKAKKVKDG